MRFRYIWFGIFLFGCAASMPVPPQVAEIEGEATSSAPLVAVPMQIVGTVRFQARTPTMKGASRTFELKPARWVDVIALNDQGQEIARSKTDLSGSFIIDSPDRATKIKAITAIHHDGYELWVTPQALGVGEYAIEAQVTGAPLQMIAYDASALGEAGAFHILDTVLYGAQTVRSWVGATLPPCYVYWARGVTSTWSFFHGQQRQGNYSIELLGGQMGRQATTDTDEHDESIILHEFGHFVFSALSTDSSPGGTHSGSILVEPGLAWEEGRATWFAGAVLQTARYLDTIGIEPTGELRVNINMEEKKMAHAEIGSEEEVEEVLWDLYDGSQGVIDTDADGIALTAPQILRAMMALREQDGEYPCISTFLARLIDQRLVTREAMITWLQRQGHAPDLLPSQGVDPWPLTLTLDSRVAGKIDALTDPAPSGGHPQPGNGIDAVRVYRIHIESAGYLELDLHIEGTGRQSDHSDIDLELRTIRTDLMASSIKEEPNEHIGMHVDSGWYIVTVRDGGGRGSRANYTLSAHLVP